MPENKTEKIKGYTAKREFLPSNGLFKLIETRDLGVARSSSIVRRKRGNNFPENESAVRAPAWRRLQRPQKMRFQS